MAGGEGNVALKGDASPNEMEVELERGDTLLVGPSAGETVRPTETGVRSDGDPTSEHEADAGRARRALCHRPCRLSLEV